MTNGKIAENNALENLFDVAWGYMRRRPVWPDHSNRRILQAVLPLLSYLDLIKVDQECDGGFKPTPLLTTNIKSAKRFPKRQGLASAAEAYALDCIFKAALGDVDPIWALEVLHTLGLVEKCIAFDEGVRPDVSWAPTEQLVKLARAAG